MKQLKLASYCGLTLTCSSLLLGIAQGGELETSPATGTEKSGDWCDWLGNKPGTLYKNSDNPFIQQFQVFGRYQWQAAYMTGEDVNGYEYSDAYDEHRRFRLGASLQFLQFLELKANVNLVDDTRPGGGEAGWGYEDFDEALLIFNAKKAFGIDALDELEVSYGRHKFVLGTEAIESSKKLLTVERSAISNKVYGSYRPTGLSVNAVKGDWRVSGAIYSTDASVTGGNVELLGGWNDGLAYYLGVGYTPNDNWDFYWDFVYNDADTFATEDSLWGYEWATSFAAAYKNGPWGINNDFYFGDNGDARNGVGARTRQGNFWGVVMTPYYWVIEDKLQAVVRYQYQGSSEQAGIRTNSRYFRSFHGPTVNVNGGRGDTHHSLYAGLNYLICGHNLKIQTGIEYDWLNAPTAGTAGDASALTYWFAFRSYF